MKCSSLVAVAALAVTSALAPAAASAATDASAVQMALSPTVKTAKTLPYLVAATSVRNTFAVDVDQDHQHGASNMKVANDESAFRA